jgi:Fe-S cluster assembly protein SufD
VIEHYAGDAFSESLTNAVTELLIAEDANLAHLVVQQTPVAASQIHRIEAQHANLAAAVAALPAAGDDVVLVFADGRFVADLSRNTAAKGLSVQSLAVGLGSDPKSVEKVFGRCLDAGSHGFAALNAAFAADGALVTIGQGVAAKQNVHILNYCMDSVTAAGSPTLNHMRNIVVAEARRDRPVA